jgi:hypothetical protein
MYRKSGSPLINTLWRVLSSANPHWIQILCIAQNWKMITWSLNQKEKSWVVAFVYMHPRVGRQLYRLHGSTVVITQTFVFKVTP